MSRLYAQLCTLIFAVVSVVGVFLGNAAVGQGGHGNLGSLTLHLTWVRDAVDVVALAAFVYVGFFASRRTGRTVMLVVGTLFLVFGLAGFLIGDNDQASKPFLGMNFPMLVNLFDLTIGLFGVLAAFGTLSDAEIESQPSIIRPGTVAPKR